MNTAVIPDNKPSRQYVLYEDKNEALGEEELKWKLG
jgi:hypothetical protein